MRVKICGLTDRVSVDAAVAAGAAYTGFVFFEKSPRHLNLPDAARLAAGVPAGICKVALTVDADDVGGDRECLHHEGFLLTMRSA